MSPDSKEASMMHPYSPQYGLSLGRIFQQFGIMGEDYIPHPDAPSTFPDLLRVYRECASTRTPFPVYDGGCENTIYGTPEANYAFRYLHDTVHALTGLEFDVASEIATAKAQLRMLGPLAKEEIRTFLIDTAGQALWVAMTGEFLVDQSMFVEWVYTEMCRQDGLYANTPQGNEIELLTLAVRNYYREVNP
jgi:hypothetical protein